MSSATIPFPSSSGIFFSSLHSNHSIRESFMEGIIRIISFPLFTYVVVKVVNSQSLQNNYRFLITIWEREAIIVIFITLFIFLNIGLNIEELFLPSRSEDPVSRSLFSFWLFVIFPSAVIVVTFFFSHQRRRMAVIVFLSFSLFRLDTLSFSSFLFY